jgi:hypothetical protein
MAINTTADAGAALNGTVASADSCYPAKHEGLSTH